MGPRTVGAPGVGAPLEPENPLAAAQTPEGDQVMKLSGRSNRLVRE
jgi:hypothetical protein